jgi:glucose/arabinose dehydrogenase
MIRHFRWLAAASLIAMAVPAFAQTPPFDVRPGYRVTLAASGLDEARFMAFDDRGVLYVSQLRLGRVLALRDEDADGIYERKDVFLDNQKHVHGLCWHDGWMWFAPSRAVGKARDTDGDGRADDVRMILEGLPGETGHLWRSMLVTDECIYTGVGDTGNITDEMDSDRQKIWRYRHDGSDKTLFASGIRNTEKLRLRPGTQEVWGVDHGSDWFGRPVGDERGRQPITDLVPPDEFNHYVEGGFYGHPFLVGSRIPRIEYQDRDDLIALAQRTIVPQWQFGAHWAANGFAFVSLDNAHLPVDHRGDAFVACHGSWNSQRKVGYRVERVLFDDVTGEPYGALRIVSTLGDGQTVQARPVDCAQAPDGSILFSCDVTQSVYRIEWVGDR